jgi:hypothetical protein
MIDIDGSGQQVNSEAGPDWRVKNEISNNENDVSTYRNRIITEMPTTFLDSIE